MPASINNVINVTLLEEGRAAARDNINVCAITEYAIRPTRYGLSVKT